MGYASYTLPNGRAAGYGIEATCDHDGCEAEIDRGMGYLCGRNPDGWRSEMEPGCGKYFCGDHLYGNHDCPSPECGKYSADGALCCELIEGHDDAHACDGDTFVMTEEDEE